MENEHQVGSDMTARNAGWVTMKERRVDFIWHEGHVWKKGTPTKSGLARREALQELGVARVAHTNWLLRAGERHLIIGAIAAEDIAAVAAVVASKSDAEYSVTLLAVLDSLIIRPLFLLLHKLGLTEHVRLNLRPTEKMVTGQSEKSSTWKLS